MRPSSVPEGGRETGQKERGVAPRVSQVSGFFTCKKLLVVWFSDDPLKLGRNSACLPSPHCCVLLLYKRLSRALGQQGQDTFTYAAALCDCIFQHDPPPWRPPLRALWPSQDTGSDWDIGFEDDVLSTGAQAVVAAGPMPPRRLDATFAYVCDQKILSPNSATLNLPKAF